MGFSMDSLGFFGISSVLWGSLKHFLGSSMDFLGFLVSYEDSYRISWDFRWIPWDSLGSLKHFVGFSMDSSGYFGIL